MDSPVLKPALIRISTARLIGVAASAQSTDDGPIAPAWVEVAPGASGPPASEPPPPPAAPRRIGSSATITAGASAVPRRVIDDAGARLKQVEAQIADAEMRLSETQDLLEKLEREANVACAMVEDARQQAAAICEEARQEGQREGLEQARREMADALDAVAALTEGAVRARAALLQQTEPEVVELVFEIARKVIGQHLALNKEAIAEVARRALSVAGQADTYYLHLHPDDVGFVEQHLRRDTLGIPLEVVTDERLCPGDCLIRTTHGRVDACLETQLREVHEQMVGAT